MRAHQRFHEELAARPPARRAEPADALGAGRVDAARRQRRRQVTDGPFTELAEQVIGFYLVETDDRADLVDWCRILGDLVESATASRSARPSGRGVVNATSSSSRWTRRSGPRRPPRCGRRTSTRTTRSRPPWPSTGPSCREQRSPTPIRRRPGPRRRVDRHRRPVRRADRAGRRLLRRRAARPRHRDRRLPAAPAGVRRRDPAGDAHRGLRPDVTAPGEVLARTVREEWGRLRRPPPRAVPAPGPRRGRARRRGRGRRPDLAGRRRSGGPGRVADSRPPGGGCSTGCGRRRWRPQGAAARRRGGGRRTRARATWRTPDGSSRTTCCGWCSCAATRHCAPEVASALALRLVVGVPTADIARLFLVPEPTMAARVTRGKKKIVAAGIPFAVPGADDLPDRLGSSRRRPTSRSPPGTRAASGPDLLRAELAGEAIRLVRVTLALRRGAGSAATAGPHAPPALPPRRPGGRRRRPRAPARPGPVQVAPRRDRRGGRPAARARPWAGPARRVLPAAGA